MLSIAKILVSTDFSENAECAFAQARNFADRFKAEVILVHVVEPPVYPTSMFGVGAVSLPTLHDEMRAAAQKQLDATRERLAADGLKTTAILRDGTPSVEILGVAEDEKADLIVIATHGHTGIKHLLLGSTAERVVRGAKGPVLTVHGEHEESAEG